MNIVKLWENRQGLVNLLVQPEIMARTFNNLNFIMDFVSTILYRSKDRRFHTSVETNFVPSKCAVLS